MSLQEVSARCQGETREAPPGSTSAGSEVKAIEPE